MDGQPVRPPGDDGRPDEELYGLTDEQVEFPQDYLTDFGANSGRAGTGDENLSYAPVVADG